MFFCTCAESSVQGPVRDAVKAHGAGVADISEEDLRPVVIRDFQVRHLLHLHCADLPCLWGLQ